MLWTRRLGNPAKNIPGNSLRLISVFSERPITASKQFFWLPLFQLFPSISCPGAKKLNERKKLDESENNNISWAAGSGLSHSIWDKWAGGQNDLSGLCRRRCQIARRVKEVSEAERAKSDNEEKSQEREKAM
jgi:hypothetical protein